MLPRFFAHAHAVVLYLHAHAAAVLGAVYAHLSAILAELYCVAQYVQPNLGKHLLVGGILNLVQIYIKAYVPGFPFLFKQQYACAQLLIQAERGLVRNYLLVFNPRQRKYVGRHVGKPVGLAYYYVRVFLPLGFCNVALFKLPRKAAYGYHGRSELMRERIDEVPAEKLRAAQLLRHHVKAFRKLLKLVPYALYLLYADGEIPLCNAAHGPYDLLHGPEVPPREQRVYARAHRNAYAKCNYGPHHSRIFHLRQRAKELQQQHDRDRKRSR